MKICLFYQSIVSDWNHGNAHFLRGMVSSLMAEKHEVIIYEPLKGWSFNNMLADAGIEPVCEFAKRFPKINVQFFDENLFDPEVLHDAELVIVHEWNKPELIGKIGNHRKTQGNYALLFHDTHHRALTDPSMQHNDLSGYDGVLAFGEVIRNIYLDKCWTKQAWTLHEAADIINFHPVFPREKHEGELVWIGNWGDNERTAELYEFLINPVKELGLKAKVYGVRYPSEAIKALRNADIEYGGWLPNYKVPEVFSRYRVTIHVPRRPYVEKLPGIPTIRPFEAMACGIPLISSPWKDTDNLFRSNKDYLMVHDGAEMKKALSDVLTHDQLRESLIRSGLETILAKHTCKHRKDQLMDIYRLVNADKEKKLIPT